MFEIRQFASSDFDAFHALLARYYAEEVRIRMTPAESEALAHQYVSEITPTCRLWLAEAEKSAVGFAFAQIDSEASLWNERPGDGFVRDFYVVPEFRRMGAGRDLAEALESFLRMREAPCVYLTAEDSAVRFWERLGYAPTGAVCRRNRLPVWEKPMSVLSAETGK